MLYSFPYFFLSLLSKGSSSSLHSQLLTSSLLLLHPLDLVLGFLELESKVLWLSCLMMMFEVVAELES